MRLVFSTQHIDALFHRIKAQFADHFHPHGHDAPTPDDTTTSPAPATPDLRYLREQFSEAIASFYATIQRIMADNPVDMNEFIPLAARAGKSELSEGEATRFAELKLAAKRQGRAVGAVYGFFLKYKPYPMLAEIRAKEAVFQPPFGPVLVARGDAVHDVLSRHHDFTVDPYGVEMRKTMTPLYNGGFDTFILGTDDDAKYIEDKQLLTTVVAPEDAQTITDMIHQECRLRVGAAVAKARKDGNTLIDVVPAVARFVPVVLAHHYLGVPAAEQRGSFELDEHMLHYYGDKIIGPDGHTPLPMHYRRPDGTEVELPNSALQRGDGVIPDEQQVYQWIVAAFRNFFNNVQKDVEVQAHGVRACRELLSYILREIGIQRQALQTNPDGVADTMLSRLLKIQMNTPLSSGQPPVCVDPARVSDLRIAENVMGTIVGAVAGQEEATCRVIDTMMRLKEGLYSAPHDSTAAHGLGYGSFDEARSLALNIMDGRDVERSRADLRRYVLEALRLEPQGEVLLRVCAKQGATIADSRPLRAGTLVFTAHGSAMQDIEQADTFVLGRDARHYLQYGAGRHKCLGQYVSPVLMLESLVALLALENLHRPQAGENETAFPRETRFGHFQLDVDNLYANTFTLAFDDQGTTRQYYRWERP